MKTKTTSKKTAKPALKPNALPNPDGVTIGIDMGDKKHAICAIDASGEIVDERTITNTRESLRRLSKKHAGARIVIEVGSSGI